MRTNEISPIQPPVRGLRFRAYWFKGYAAIHWTPYKVGKLVIWQEILKTVGIPDSVTKDAAAANLADVAVLPE
jgi:hypothetical protein